jgi:hypothetical protein
MLPINTTPLDREIMDEVYIARTQHPGIYLKDLLTWIKSAKPTWSLSSKVRVYIKLETQR